jgi:hypothetical protein
MPWASLSNFAGTVAVEKDDEEEETAQPRDPAVVFLFQVKLLFPAVRETGEESPATMD